MPSGAQQAQHVRVVRKCRGGDAGVIAVARPFQRGLEQPPADPAPLAVIRDRNAQLERVSSRRN